MTQTEREEYRRAAVAEGDHDALQYLDEWEATAMAKTGADKYQTGSLIVWRQRYNDGEREHAGRVQRIIDANSIVVRQTGLDTSEPGWGEVVMIDSAQIVAVGSLVYKQALSYGL